MIFRNLDANGDWTFGQGKQNYVSGNAAIGLNIRTRILSWVGDCFFDLLAGIDWTNRLGSKNQRSLLESDLRRIITTSYGVTGIASFSSQINVRSFTATYSVNTIFGKVFTDTVTQEI